MDKNSNTIIRQGKTRLTISAVALFIASNFGKLDRLLCRWRERIVFFKRTRKEQKLYYIEIFPQSGFFFFRNPEIGLLPVRIIFSCASKLMLVSFRRANEVTELH